MGVRFHQNKRKLCTLITISDVKTTDNVICTVNYHVTLITTSAAKTTDDVTCAQ